MKQKDQTDFEKWLRQKAQGATEPEVSAEFLAAQRRSIYRRLNEPRPNWIPVRWALSLAMVLLIFAGGIALERSHKVAAPVISDEQLFSDLSALDQSNEPRAIQPMHGLFQE
jgi:hypothetical protein